MEGNNAVKHPATFGKALGQSCDRMYHSKLLVVKGLTYEVIINFRCLMIFYSLSILAHKDLEP